MGLGLAAPGSAQAAPIIDSTLLKGSAVTGRTVELHIRASDRQAPVTGLVVGFGRGESGYGLSSCLPPDYRGRSFGPVTRPGRKVTLAAPHVYSTTGKRSVVANVSSGGCTLGNASTVQNILVQVVRPGQRPPPIITTTPVTVPIGSLVPSLPGLGELPKDGVNVGLPGVPTVDLPDLPPITLPALPGLPPPPTIPAVPTPPITLPTLPKVPIVGGLLPNAAARGRGCRNRFRWYSRSRAEERKARAALLCLLNAERRRRKLRPMRANARLERAARAHSRTMVQRRFFAHVGPGTMNPAARLRSTRYLPGRGRWAIGENIGFGTGALTRPIAIHTAWMHSTPHRAAMLSPRFREVGFGVYPGSPYLSRGATFTADFAVNR
ncbi:MAG TPA: CAP domain-containing protein [Thermoleophilaceae bacterium]|nr:CAP domain-containing protein [Thermoleophilaceae bacterium]